MKAYKSVIKAALSDGYTCHIDQGEGEIVKTTGYQDAVDAVEAVEESWILVVSPSKKNAGKWVRHAALYVIWGWGMDDEETVADWHCNKDPEVRNWADRWSDAYYADNSFAGPVDGVSA